MLTIKTTVIKVQNHRERESKKERKERELFHCITESKHGGESFTQG